jgi:LysM repeat protein
MKIIFKLFIAIFILHNVNVYAEACSTEHTIQPGDTVFSLSKKHNIKIDEIYKCNPSLNGEPNLKLGQKIKISTFTQATPTKVEDKKTVINEKVPEKKETEPQKTEILDNKDTKPVSVSEKKPSSEIKNIDPNYHVVSDGETLYGIARKYDIKVDDLQQANDLKDTTIKIGQKIKIKKDFSKSGKIIQKDEKESKPEKPVKQTQPKTETPALYKDEEAPVVKQKTQPEEYEVESIQPQNAKNDFFSSLVRPVKGRVGKKNVNGVYFYSDSTDNVHSVQAGTVLFSSVLAKNKNFNNNYVVVVVHNFDCKKYLSSYGNLKKIYVQKGDKLVKNQVIGIVDGASEYKGQSKLFFTMMDKDGIVKSSKFPFE